MKKLIKVVIFMLLILGVYYIRPIYTYVDMNLVNKNKFDRKIVNLKKNYVYYTEQNFAKTTDIKTVKTKQDLIDIIYTSLNYGMKDITFYCSEEYDSCSKDLNDIASDDLQISFINDLVHPFHKFQKITINKNNLGRVTISYTRLYSDEEIEFINENVDKIIKELGLDINNRDKYSDRDKVKMIHDYMINNTKYSTDNDTDKNAYGFFLNKVANCRGYTEAASILLHEVGINSIPISNGHHVWNLVNIDDKWLHLDITWDDPVSSDGKNYLIYDYFLITSQALEKLNTNGDHIYDLEYYNPERFLIIE